MSSLTVSYMYITHPDYSHSSPICWLMTEGFCSYYYSSVAGRSTSFEGVKRRFYLWQKYEWKVSGVPGIKGKMMAAENELNGERETLGFSVCLFVCFLASPIPSFDYTVYKFTSFSNSKKYTVIFRLTVNLLFLKPQPLKCTVSTVKYSCGWEHISRNFSCKTETLHPFTLFLHQFYFQWPCNNGSWVCQTLTSTLFCFVRRRIKQGSPS